MNRIAAPSRSANVLIDADHAGVKNYTKSGDDLIIEFADGKVVRIEGFFAHGADYNNLVFVHNGDQWVADFSHAQDGDGLELNATHGMIGESSSAKALLGVLAVAAAGGGIAVAASGGGSRKAEAVTSGPEPAPRDPNIAVAEEYELARAKGTIEALEVFIARHPDHPLAEQARAYLKEGTSSGGIWSSDPSVPDDTDKSIITPTDPDANTARDPNIAVAEEYEEAKAKGTVEALELFIVRHPDHPLAEQARAYLKEGTDASPNGTVIIAIPGCDPVVVKVKPDGTWSFMPPSSLADGTYTATVTQKDSQGNVTEESTMTFTVDKAAPDAPVIGGVFDNLGPGIQLGFNGDGIYDKTPTFYGGGEPNTLIRVYDENGKLVGHTIADEDGNWSVELSQDLSEGKHSFTVTSTDAAGNESDPTPPFSLTVVQPPPPPAPTIGNVWDDVASPYGLLNNGDRTNDVTPTLRGTGVAGETISVYDNGVYLGSTTVNSHGNWLYTPVQPLAEGSHALQVTAGTLGSERGKSGAFDLVVDTTAPTAIATVVEAVPIANSHSVDTGFSVTAAVMGIVGPDEKVQISLDDGRTWNDAISIGGNEYRFEVAVYAVPSHARDIFQARVIDAAGNIGTTTTYVHRDDLGSLPYGELAIDSFRDEVGTVKGYFRTGSSTDDRQPILYGRASVGDEVHIYEGSTLLGTATRSPGGFWHYQIDKDLSEGVHTFTAVVTDWYGDEWTSAPFSLTVDLTGPTTGNAVAITSYHDDVAAMVSIYPEDVGAIGDFNTGTATDDRRPELHGTVSGLQSDDVVRIYEGSLLLGTARVTGDTWSFQIGRDLIDGIHSFRAVIADAAGNNGTASMDFEVNVRATAPAATLVTDDHTFNLTLGHEMLLFELLAGDNTGGNGSKTVNGFTVGVYETIADADRIDLSSLLVDYVKDADGPAHYVDGVAKIDAGDNIADYLNVTQRDGNTIISIDRDGNASNFAMTELVTLNGVSTDLETLLANHQIVI